MVTILSWHVSKESFNTRKHVFGVSEILVKTNLFYQQFYKSSLIIQFCMILERKLSISLYLNLFLLLLRLFMMDVTMIKELFVLLTKMACFSWHLLYILCLNEIIRLHLLNSLMLLPILYNFIFMSIPLMLSLSILGHFLTFMLIGHQSSLGFWIFGFLNTVIGIFCRNRIQLKSIFLLILIMFRLWLFKLAWCHWFMSVVYK